MNNWFVESKGFISAVLASCQNTSRIQLMPFFAGEISLNWFTVPLLPGPQVEAWQFLQMAHFLVNRCHTLNGS
jgi:hypothetical protein